MTREIVRSPAPELQPAPASAFAYPALQKSRQQSFFDSLKEVRCQALKMIYDACKGNRAAKGLFAQLDPADLSPPGGESQGNQKSKNHTSNDVSSRAARRRVREISPWL